MGYQFREIRLHDVAEALAFAKAQGLSVDKLELRHNLSLMVKQGGEAVAAAFCVEPEPGHFTMHFAVSVEDDADGDALCQELADRTLRKMQAEGIGAAKVCGAAAESEATLWDRSNWLERIQAVSPPGVEAEDSEFEEPAQPVSAA